MSYYVVLTAIAGLLTLCVICFLGWLVNQVYKAMDVAQRSFDRMETKLDAILKDRNDQTPPT